MAFKLAGAFVDLQMRDANMRNRLRGLRGRLQKLKVSMEKVAAAGRRMLMVTGGVVAGTTALLYKQQRAEAKLEAVLRSTGNAAGFSAEQLKQRAAALQRMTTYGDESVISLQALLATFKEVKGDEFERATQAVLDMSTVMEQDLRSGAIQVGKALNDPIQGVTALRRVGVQLTAQQEKLIGQMMQMGQVAKAQRVILGELESQFGGAARAAAETSGGGLIQLKNTLSDIAELIGKAFAPMLRRLQDRIMALAPSVADWVKHNGRLIATVAKVTVVVGGLLVVLPKLLGLLTLVAAHPVAAALIGITAAVTGLVWALREAPPVIERVDADLGRLHKSTVRLHDADMALARRLDELLAKQRRSNAEQAEANRIARELESRYGNLGITYDQAGNAISMAATALRGLTAVMREQLQVKLADDMREVNAELNEQQKAAGEATANLEKYRAKLAKIQEDNKNSTGYAPPGTYVEGPVKQRMDKAEQELKKHTENLDDLRQRRAEIVAQMDRLRPDTAPDRGVEDRFKPMGAGPDLANMADAHQRTQETITDLYRTEAEKRVAAVNQQYERMEQTRAKALARMVDRADDVNARLVAMSHARLTEQEKAQRDALRDELAALQQRIEAHKQQGKALSKWRVDKTRETLAEMEREEREAAAERRRRAAAEAEQAQQERLQRRADAMREYADDMRSLNDELVESNEGRQALELRRLDRWHRRMLAKYSRNAEMRKRIDAVYMARRQKMRQAEADRMKATWAGLTEFYKRFQAAIYNQDKQAATKPPNPSESGRQSYAAIVDRGDRLEKETQQILRRILDAIEANNRRQQAPTPVGR